LSDGYLEKEPDWDKFHIFQFPDGREVYEISLANTELIFPAYLSDSLPGTEPNNVVIQNIMFVENKENGRYDPVIARYYPNNENSIREFDEIYYNMIDLGWSGTVDIWTYDERHFIGFNIIEGELVSTVRYDTGNDENAKIKNGYNLLTVDCFRVPTTVSYTYTTTGYYETTVVATQNYETICSSGGSAAPGYGNDNGITYPYLGPSDGGGSGGYGSVGEPTYIPPAIASPGLIIYNQLTNPCAREIFTNLKRNHLNSPFKNGDQNPLANFDFASEIYELFEDSQIFDLIIQNGNLEGKNGLNSTKYNSETRKPEIWITLSNEYLNNATRLSIARTIIHEMVHGYIIYELNSGNFDFQNNFQQEYVKYLNRKNPDINRAHHEFMGAYVDMMAFSLKKWDTFFGDGKGTLGDSYYEAMAFGGLFKTGTNIPTDSFKELIPNSTQRSNIIKIIENEQNGSNLSKGKKCD